MAYNYPYGDTQQLNLNWFLAQWETFREQWATAEEGIDHALDAEIARVEAAMTDLYAARDAAAASQAAAQTAATNAASSATVATQQASLAQSQAATAQNQAQIATAAAEAAGNSASSASNSASNANLSKVQAGNSATAAGQSATLANDKATAAGLSAAQAGVSATNAAGSAEDSEAWAVGERGGSPVASGDDTYENNSKYYADQAATVAASIPADYTELSDDVSELKTAIPQITDSRFFTNFSRGYIKASTGANASSNYFARMDTYYSTLLDTITLTVDATYTFYVVEFNSDKTLYTTYGTESSVKSGSITINNTIGHLFKVVLGMANQTSFPNPPVIPENAVTFTATKTVINPKYLYVENVVFVGEGLDAEEIQDAVDAIEDYGTIIVFPKDTPYKRFTMMREESASYLWTGLPKTKHISIIGLDKSKCVIQSTTGNYDTPPAEIATNGIIKNLTFIATHTDSDGTETTGSFAVHVDNRPADTNGMKMVFENCKFVSYQTCAVGLGLYRNQDIKFDSCDFISITDPTWKPNENYDSEYMCRLGAFNMHTAMGYASGNMFLRLRRCFFWHEGGLYAVTTADQDETQTAYLEAIENTLWDVDNANAGYHSNSTQQIMQMPYNHGNNAASLNA